jgi:alpha-tubulin suppressor-like RCC1 family protein
LKNSFNKTETGVYCFGLNEVGQLGLGNTINQTTPQLMTSLKNEKIKNIACGDVHTIINTGNSIIQ